MFAHKLGNVPVQMLGRYLVKRPLVRPFQHRPEGLNAVGMRHAVDELVARGLDRFMRVWDAHIRRSVVGNKILQRSLVRQGDNLCTDLIDFAVFGSDNRRHIHSTASLGVLASRIRLVLTLTTDIGLVKLHRAIKRAVLSVTCPRFPDTMHHEPGGFLLDTDIPA